MIEDSLCFRYGTVKDPVLVSYSLSSLPKLCTNTVLIPYSMYGVGALGSLS